MTGQYIQLAAKDGSGSFRGYLAVPASGHGPGLVIAQEIFGVNKTMRDVADYYAEEGYVALVPDLFWRQQPDVELGYSEADWQQAFEFYGGFDEAKGMEDIQAALDVLRDRPEVVERQAGVLGFCLGGKLAYLAACRTDADVSVGYYGVGIDAALEEAKNIRKPLLLHVAELDKFCPPEARERIVQALKGHPKVALHVYPGVDHAFARAGGDHFHKPSALMAHERSIAALKAAIGPHYDLSALWDKHCEYEFGTRNVDDTMSTMVAEPYVNHIPTMTGGVGYRDLHAFYTNHFVNSNPPDTALTSISRTVGATQVVDELLFSFTHTTEIPWMLPGVAPTGRRVEVPLLAVIKFRGDKLYHEHIYWDQASVLVQVGLLDPKLLPVAGIETARKLLDETLPSNTLMP
ncbi:carboxymethylenebutenolidase [Variovorax paradoxus]|jgi:carboxymethylenebutenolidase|uniref:dienelactone hydrolase family protein n=1 Tax=Variovorax paradoxus TaxID=34073 RepID=UPI0006E4C3A1|nr:carboxymethylenebutenolidase [Variovorax paradoxus]KPU96990.1 carboxymethylenebutenolidase [Variovorax paradoxus]KPU98210.1 carboxymethylenebutenolidase [Variovorax paradoxus]KPV09465.1 carboxymethylenebutenolidase [Variovorax paradoxus]KPV16908.1 carboxymethylenebutenolidase [Variovorax paradoxus]